MDFDFFKGFECLGSVKLGSALTPKIIALNSFNALEIFELKFPEGHQDAGNVMDAYGLEEQRYAFAKDISQLISEECSKILSNREKQKIEKSDSPSNPQVLSNLLSMVLDTESTSFTLG